MTAWQKFLSLFRRSVRKFEAERTATESTFHFTVSVEEDKLDGGYVAAVVDLPGCMSQGETFEEAVDNVMDAFHEVLTARVEEQLAQVTSLGTVQANPRTLKVAVPC